MKKKSIEILIHQYVDSVIKQTEAIMDYGSAKLSNKFAKKSLLYLKELFEWGDEGKKALLILFKHERPDVRCSAAVFLLKYKTDDALKALKELSKGKGLVAFEAQEAIKRWKEGNWHLDEF